TSTVNAVACCSGSGGEIADAMPASFSASLTIVVAAVIGLAPLAWFGLVFQHVVRVRKPALREVFRNVLLQHNQCVAGNVTELQFVDLVAVLGEGFARLWAIDHLCHDSLQKKGAPKSPRIA